MAITVRLTNKSQVTRPEASEASDGTILFSRAIYQILGSLIGNREMVTTDEVTKVKTIHWEKLPREYAEFADDMNNLWQHTFYPELAVLNEVPLPSDSIVKANEYLGDLGMVDEYRYAKDFVDIPAWVGIVSRDEYRILMDESDNTYLVDTTDNTVLVSYN